MRRSSLLVALAAVLAVGLFPASAAADRTTFKVQFVCNDRGHVFPLAGARVEFRKRGWSILPKWFDDTVMAGTYLDGEGRAQFTVSGDEDDFYFRVLLVDHDGIRAEDWYAPWPWFADTRTHENDVPVRDYGTQGVGNGTISPECAAFEGARAAYNHYWDVTGERPPYGNLKVNVNSPSAGQPFAHYTTIHWPPRYPPAPTPGSFTTSFHEFAHTFRHHFDGSRGHFYEDVVNFKYLQHHSPCKEVSSSAFAFNEGWAEYWAGDWKPAPDCPGLAPDNYRVEGNVAAALAALDRQCPGVGRREMVDVLRRNPGGIHSFEDFQRALGCRLLTPHERAREANARRFGLIPITKIVQQQRSAVRTTIRRLGKVRLSAIRDARRPGACPPKPCVNALQRAIRPALIGAELGQARLLYKTLGVHASTRALKRLGSPLSRRFGRIVRLRRVAFRRGSAKVGVKALRKALRAAAPFLRKDPTGDVAAIGRALRSTLATFRAGRLPSGFEIQTPASAGAAPAAPWAAPSLPPSPTPTPEPTPTPPPAPKPDLVIDRVYTTSDTGWMWNVDVRNAGAGSAPATKTGLTRQGTSEPVLIDTPALAPGESVTVRTECPYGSLAQATARADASGVADESDEANNEGSGSGGTDGRCRYP